MRWHPFLALIDEFVPSESELGGLDPLALALAGALALVGVLLILRARRRRDDERHGR